MTEIKYLVFSGGGAAIYAHGGALEQLAKEPNFSYQNIEAVAGSSAGSLIALALSLNFEPSELAARLQDLDINQFADGGFFPCKMIRLFSQYGSHLGIKLYQYINELIREKTGRLDPENVTFEDLKTLGCKNLYVVTTKLLKENDIPIGKQKIFSYEKTPYTPVAACVLASCAAPFFFRRVRLLKVSKGKYVLDEKGDLFEDGGIMNNYPIDIFDSPRFMPKDCLLGLHEVINPHTLGFALLTANQINTEHKPVVKKPINDNHPIEFTMALANSLTLKLQKQNLEKKSNRDRTIQIDRQKINFTKLNLDKKMKQELALEGKQAVITYFKLRSGCNNQFFHSKSNLPVRLSVDENKETKKEKVNCCTIV